MSKIKKIPGNLFVTDILQKSEQPRGGIKGSKTEKGKKFRDFNKVIRERACRFAQRMDEHLGNMKQRFQEPSFQKLDVVSKFKQIAENCYLTIANEVILPSIPNIVKHNLGEAKLLNNSKESVSSDSDTAQQFAEDLCQALFDHCKKIAPMKISKSSWELEDVQMELFSKYYNTLFYRSEDVIEGIVDYSHGMVNSLLAGVKIGIASMLGWAVSTPGGMDLSEGEISDSDLESYKEISLETMKNNSKEMAKGNTKIERAVSGDLSREGIDIEHVYACPYEAGKVTIEEEGGKEYLLPTGETRKKAAEEYEKQDLEGKETIGCPINRLRVPGGGVFLNKFIELMQEYLKSAVLDNLTPNELLTLKSTPATEWYLPGFGKKS